MKRNSTRLILVLGFFILFFMGCGEDVDKCENVNCGDWQECSEGKCVAKEGSCDFDKECTSEQLCNIFTNKCEEKCETGESKCEENKTVICINNLWQETDCSDKICKVNDHTTAFCMDKSELVSREITVDLHISESNRIDLTTYAKTNDDCDIIIKKSSAGPIITLCENTFAYNNGNGSTFLEVVKAPDEEHIGDNPPEYAIGKSWRTGDSGETGFTMTKNIYTIKRSDNSYAKLEVLKSMGGKVTVLLYADPNGGNDLSCLESK